MGRLAVDIICPKCGEPWDVYCLGEETEVRLDPLGLGHSTATRGDYSALWTKVRVEFTRNGCAALDGAYPGASDECVPVKSALTLAASTLYELLGDDIDGAASMLDDMRTLGFPSL